MIHDTKKVGDARPEAEQTLIRVTMDYFNLHFNYWFIIDNNEKIYNICNSTFILITDL